MTASTITIKCVFCPNVISESGDDLDVLAVLARSDEHMAKAHPKDGNTHA